MLMEVAGRPAAMLLKTSVQKLPTAGQPAKGRCTHGQRIEGEDATRLHGPGPTAFPTHFFTRPLCKQGLP
jgi:hypothetical protein